MSVSVNLYMIAPLMTTGSFAHRQPAVAEGAFQKLSLVKRDEVGEDLANVVPQGGPVRELVDELAPTR